ncbi:flagella synthesis protein FlgN [Paraburkholderia youngii]|uniref:flagella synthesis protein FlgN n=1 Tax=Paraburkholderia youngii TaxID=2782701 RepID=UPI003D1C7ECC
MRDVLQSVMTEEHSATEQLASLLELERKALASSGQTPLLQAVIDRKSETLKNLAALELRRDEALRALGYPAGRAGLERIARQDRRVGDTWARLKACIERVRRASELNAALVTIRMDSNNRAFESLQPTPPRADFYGPDGRVTAFASA